MENLTIGAELVAKERQKQIDKHGFTAEHHVNHPEWYEEGQLINAAQGLSQYNPDSDRNKAYRDMVPENWDLIWWQKMCDRSHKERLIISGALIVAELDRLTELELQEEINVLIK